MMLSSPSKQVRWCLLFLLVLMARVVVADSFTAAETKVFAELMAERHDFDPGEVQALLARAEVLESVLEAIARPAEGKAWHEYREIFLKPVRIQRGADFLAAHRATLLRAEA